MKIGKAIKANYETTYNTAINEILDQIKVTASDKAILAGKDNLAGKFVKSDMQKAFFDNLKANTLDKSQLAVIDATRLEQEKILKYNSTNKFKQELTKNIGIDSKKVDDKVKSNVDKNNKENKKLANNSNIEDTYSIVLKALYEEMLDEYYNLKQEVDRELARDNELNPHNGIYRKYLLYQNFLRKVDSEYKNRNGRYVAIDDESIKEKEKKYLRLDLQGEYKLQKDLGNSINRITDIQNEIDQISELIVELSNDFQKGILKAGEYNTKLENLKEKLYRKNIELDRLEPTKEEIKNWQEAKKEQQDDENRVVGTYYRDQKEKQGLLDSKILDGERKLESKSNNNIDNIYDNNIENLEAQKAIIEEEIENIAKQISDNKEKRKNSRGSALADLDNVYTDEEILEQDIHRLRKQLDNIDIQISEERQKKSDNKVR
ncbi:MAG: hypothetical protein N2749_03245 [Clostridia bacterium]|nr:hypothetical protein [Clostridia bacterium]